MNITLKILQSLAKPLLGKGLIDKHAPFLIPFFQTIYARVQKNRLKIVSIPEKSRLKLRASDLGVGLPLLLKGSYEPTLTNLFLETVKPGDTVLDIGANIGYYTILASKKVGSKGKVIAFEPDQENINLLKENIALNNCTNVKVEEVAISDTAGFLSFHSEDHNKGESKLAKNELTTSSYQVLSQTLDNYLKSHPSGKISVIKMDIEGAEVLALEGAKKFFSTQKELTLFIEYNPSSIRLYNKKPEELLRLLESYGCEIISIIDEARGLSMPYSEKNLTTVLSRTTYCNLFCKVNK